MRIRISGKEALHYKKERKKNSTVSFCARITNNKRTVLYFTITNVGKIEYKEGTDCSLHPKPREHNTTSTHFQSKTKTE